jgi:hypothetical protein
VFVVSGSCLESCRSLSWRMTITEYGYTTREAHDQSKAGLDQVLDKMAATFAPKSN